MYRKTYVEIDLDKIKSNIKTVIDNYKYDYYFGVVKGNAYGHGFYTIKTMIESGINYLCVSSLEEALKVREYDKHIPILCLEPIELEFINECTKHDITITIHDIDYLNKLLEMKVHGKLKVHIKIDSGLNRLGFKVQTEVDYAYQLLIDTKHLILEGIYSHFATSGINDKQWMNQLATFRKLTSNIDLTTIPIVHLDRSITFLNHDKIDICNGIRIGVAMYGYNPTPVYGNSFRHCLRKLKNTIKTKFYHLDYQISNHKFLPALSLYSNVIQIKDAKRGEFVGYGSHRLDEDTMIGIIPIGFADGFNRSNKGRSVIINNKRYQLLGEVGMNMVMVAVDDNVKVGDKVTLIGEGISNREVSNHNKTTVYETMSALQEKLPRVYMSNKEIVYVEEEE